MAVHWGSNRLSAPLAVLLLLAARVAAQTPVQQECLELCKKAELFKQQKKTAEAIAAYERAAALAPTAFGADAVSTGNVYHHLAELYESIGQLEKAVALHERNLKIREIRWGDDSPEAA
ncbi:MAG: tetratricopeptide repeat-containing protein, partial [Blastocatellia bacterium]|nr:tetratricopeptide repeat-containing protein [Blastocatellia bacterium]